MKYGPEKDGLSWNACREDDPNDMISVMFFGVFQELPKAAKRRVMEGALNGLNSFFSEKKPKKGRKRSK